MVKCAICEKEFEGTRKQNINSKKGVGVYCCVECRRIGKREKTKNTLLGRDLASSREKAKATMLARYGTLDTFSKARKTMVDRYGADNPMRVEEIKERAKETNKERYGVANTFQAGKARKKREETWQEKRERKGELERQIELSLYGGNGLSGVEKRKITNQKRYGVEWAIQNEEVKAKQKNGFLEVDKVKKEERKKATCLERYGVECVMRNKKVRDKSRDGLIKRLANGRVDIHDKETLREIIARVPYNERSRVQIAEQLGYKGIDRQVKELGLGYMFPCSWNVSLCEKEIQEWIKGIEPEVEFNTREYLGLKEIDIYVPRLKFGIELNGVYWHSNKIKEPKRIVDKQRDARKQGIFLMEIWDIEWRNKKEICKDYILAKLGKIEKKIGARKCELVVPTKQEKADFLNAYHILGNSADQYAYGLKYEGEIVAMATFGRNYRTSDKVDIMLNRWCCKGGVIVQGAFTKIFNYVLSIHPEWKTIVTHTDLRWSDYDKNVHALNGFKLERLVSPQPLIVKGERLLNSLAFKPSKFAKMFNIEVKNMREAIDKCPLPIVYDCGKTRNIFNR